MNAIELVKRVCQERGISIAKLERACGFSNGYIGKNTKGYFPIEKASKIADYLGIDVGLLAGIKAESETKYYLNDESARVAQEMFENKELRALHHVQQNIPPDRFKAYYDMIVRLYQTEHPGDDYDFGSQ